MADSRWRAAPLGSLLILLLAGLAPSPASGSFVMPSPWTWRCTPRIGKDAQCVKEELKVSISGSMSLEACQLICGEAGTLWPKPKSVSLGTSTVYFLPGSVNEVIIANEQDTALLNVALELFRINLDKCHPEYVEGISPWKAEVPADSQKVELNIEITGPSQDRLTLNTDDEQYSLYVETIGSTTKVTLKGKTFFGARHGLETLLQLIDFEEGEETLQIVNFADISDRPSFAYRGILLDTSRNYFSVKSIERTLDAMAANKLNTFHWHITDSHSFPMVVKDLPNMAFYGAYSSRKLYQPEEIRRIVEYGRVRGVRVLPEFDAPAHVGEGWQWGPQKGLGEMAVCVNKQPWQDYCVEPPCGQLNIANQNIYPILGKIYEQMVDLFGPIDLFHYGGDEVSLNCWNTTEQVVQYMIAKGNDLSADSYYNEWSHFQNRAYQLLTEANKGVEIPGIVWTSHLTEKGRTDQYLDRNKYIIQIWSTKEDPLIKELLEKNFRVIFSNYDALYLDCGFGAWVGAGNNWCSPYIGWQKIYDNSPNKIALNLTNNEADLSLVLGAEVTLWSEQADDSVIDSRLWPRSAALGERLWSDPESGWEAAEYRMVHHRQRLVRRGVRADRLQPEWCHQNEGQCYLRGSELP